MKPFILRWQTIFNRIIGDSESRIQKKFEPLMVYKVKLNGNNKKRITNKPSAILKRCEGARGILIMNKTQEQPFFPHSVLKRTRIIEIKDVSMKIRIHKEEVMNRLIYIEHVLGFLKEID